MKIKKWVQNALFIIILMCLFFISSDSENTAIFLLTKIIGLSILFASSFILNKYGRLN